PQAGISSSVLTGDHEPMAARTRSRSKRNSSAPPSGEGQGRGRSQSPVLEAQRESNLFLKALKIIGPGVITGASDDDPSGIATYASAGAALGFAPLWTAPVTFPMMAAVQFVCAKTAMVTGRGLAGIMRHHYPNAVLYPVVLALVAANTINAGTDLGAVAAAVNLFIPIPAAALIIPCALVILCLQI